MPTKNKPLENKFTRFWSKVDVKDDNECWEWQGAIIQNGYGQIGRGGIIRYAHRVAYELSKGPIPAGMYVCHSCDNKRCVNPAHLWAGTAKDNTRDAIAKGRIPFRKGELSSRAVLTEDAVIAMREGRETPREVADKFGVIWDTAWSAKVGKTWKHLPAPRERRDSVSVNGVSRV